MKIVVLDDQYGEKIAHEIKNLLGDKVNMPITEDVLSPFVYKDDLQENDILLLDNYFPGDGWEEPLGNEYLLSLLQSGQKCHIVCISDRGRRLIEEYEGWKSAEELGWVVGWCGDKSGKSIFREILQ